MPIYDHDGTTFFEIGTLYDHDGSVNRQIGKVYDHDGTTSHLIYSADLVLYQNGDTHDADSGGWGRYSDLGDPANLFFDATEMRGEIKGKYPVVGGTNYGSIAIRTNSLIDVTNFNSLKFKVKSTGSTDANFTAYLCVLTSQSPEYRLFGPQSGALIAQEISAYNSYVENTIDVSNISGSYYIGVIQRSNINFTMNIYVQEIILE